MSQSVSPQSARPPVAVSVGEHAFTVSEASALYEEIRGKSQILRGSSEKAFVFVKEDFKRLSKRLLEILAPYTITDNPTKIFVDYANESGHNHSGLQDFLDEDYAVPARTSRINLELSFLIKNTNREGVHEFKLDLYLESGISLCKVEHERGHNMDEYPFRFYSANYMISFQNYTIAKNCSTAIDDWIAALPTVEDTTTQEFLHKHRRFFKYISHFIILFTISFLCAMVVRQYFSLEPQLQYIGIAALVSVIVFANTIAGFFANRVQGSLRRLKSHSYIKLTNGDAENFIWFNKQRNRSIIIAVVGLLLAIAMNVLGKIIVNLLPAVA